MINIQPLSLSYVSDAYDMTTRSRIILYVSIAYGMTIPYYDSLSLCCKCGRLDSSLHNLYSWKPKALEITTSHTKVNDNKANLTAISQEALSTSIMPDITATKSFCKQVSHQPTS